MKRLLVAVVIVLAAAAVFGCSRKAATAVPALLAARQDPADMLREE